MVLYCKKILFSWIGIRFAADVTNLIVWPDKRICIMKDFIKILIVVLLAVLLVNKIWAGQVPVHDPSIVVVYKDAQGNS